MRKGLEEYRRKRDFTKTREPQGGTGVAGEESLYVMHKHAASHDHFDLRLEHGGVLRSWALPKGPSLKVGEKRLAIEVEDHPLEYGGFEGVIPKGEYGGGTVMLWDAGIWQLRGKPSDGKIDFELRGRKLNGRWSLVRVRAREPRRHRGARDNWLLIKRTNPKNGLTSHPDDRSVISGRTMAQIAADRDNTWRSDASQATASALDIPVSDTPVPDPKKLAGARKATFAQYVQPQLATLVDGVPAGGEWLHEIKFDGYRLMAYLDNGEVRLLTRNGKDWTERFPILVRSLKRLPVTEALLDGEVVALLKDGASSFRKLQEILAIDAPIATNSLVYQLFDLLYLDGYDLTSASLRERKRTLADLLIAAGVDPHGPLRYSDHLEGQGQSFHREICKLGLEGIVCKRADARYRSGRHRAWLKVKCTEEMELVVGGFTPPSGKRTGFGSLLLGAYHQGVFSYVGRVGSGFGAREIRELSNYLNTTQIDVSPFERRPPNSKQARWVEPRLVVDVEFSERTAGGALRHPVFRGVREDRDAAEIVLREPVTVIDEDAVAVSATNGTKSGRSEKSVAGVSLSHAQRIVYPGDGLTKGGIADYYDDIHYWILPYVANRPLSLLRCPEGIDSECFFQKHPGRTVPSRVPRVNVGGGTEGDAEQVYVRSVRDLIDLVQVGVIEFHPWGSQQQDIEHPDLMLFDLDPASDVAWTEVLRVARELRDRLHDHGFTVFPRTTGGKGLHLVVPLQATANWQQVKTFARNLSMAHAEDDPRRVTANMSKAQRSERVFIDYLRNGRGATAVASYSLRARAGAPVATPVRWHELGPALRPDRYCAGNIRRRLHALKADPWDGFLEARAALPSRVR